jgi:hypothetical protein
MDETALNWIYFAFRYPLNSGRISFIVDKLTSDSEYGVKFAS